MFDTTHAGYVWQWSNDPQYYGPLEHIDVSLIAEQHQQPALPRRAQTWTSYRRPERTGSVRIYGADALSVVAGAPRFDWAALDGWHEGDEQVFVHPTEPLRAGVDALRSDRQVRIELDGVVLAESPGPGWSSRTGFRAATTSTGQTSGSSTCHAPTETACPCKGLTFDYSDQAGLLLSRASGGHQNRPGRSR